MQRNYRLRKRKDFAQVYRRGRSQANRHLALYFQSGRQLRVGISISKKVGGAVRRNLIKRRLRECVRPMIDKIKTGRYIIVVRPSASAIDFQTLRGSFLHILKRVDCLREEK